MVEKTDISWNAIPEVDQHEVRYAGKKLFVFKL